ncbi:ribosomal protection-like ABC-F family protein [Lactobacillus sp. ESL0681]|uniref:ribosomal protection-like ABC-F family protein n=1 Tax=Lactobacillus sp. ESL0681 TaxID=2983211 RepID=UPI0023F695B1|nr:ATP-binding cassette domain-containing protein [Lactobacillus sp. ESL0681]WEV40490.1 ATP-binding cassette domain-containing protein [Lactobacillus sp. ESL0681]
MQIIDIQKISQQVNARTLFSATHLIVNEHDRVGIVGNNGAGKTTLLRLIAHELPLDQGQIIVKQSANYIAASVDPNLALSGGQQQWQLERNQILAANKLLLLDEPTNNLDSQHVELLINLLKRYRGTIILVSHDRYLLNAICSKIWSIEQQKITEYVGNYDSFVQMQTRQRQNQVKLWENQTKEKKKLQAALTTKQNQANRAAKAPKGVGKNEAKNVKNYYANKQKKLDRSAKALKQQITKLQAVKQPRKTKQIKIDHQVTNNLKNQVLVKFNKYRGDFYGQMLWQPFTASIRASDKIALIGDNGSGKTTFITQMLHSDAVSLSSAAKIGYFSQQIKNLIWSRTVKQNVMTTANVAESEALTLLASMGIERELFNQPVDELSDGQQTKVALAKVLLSEINFLLLDEPTNYLDLASIQALEQFMQQFSGAVLLISHDQALVQNVATTIWHIANNKIIIN